MNRLTKDLNTPHDDTTYADIVKDCVRIQENKTFTVGRTYKTLSECSEYPQIFDINCSQSVR